MISNNILLYDKCQLRGFRPCAYPLNGVPNMYDVYVRIIVTFTVYVLCIYTCVRSIRTKFSFGRDNGGPAACRRAPRGGARTGEFKRHPAIRAGGLSPILIISRGARVFPGS